MARSVVVSFFDKTELDNDIIALLSQVNTIAMIGASNKEHRDSYKVFEFLLTKGYRVFPVNPSLQGTKILGQEVYACVADIPVDIDMIDVFRDAKFLYDIVEQAIRLKIPCIWTQLGVVDVKAKCFAEQNNIKMISNRCPIIEYSRLDL